MAITVRRADSGAVHRDFFRVPGKLNGHDPIWIPALRPDLERSLSEKNPFFRNGIAERELFVAYDGREPVGRILAHVHHASNALHGEKAGFFGLLETPDDAEVARALFGAAAESHRRRGLNVLRGPYELSITQCIGAVVSGFDEPASFLQSWNPPHHAALYERLGFDVVYRASTFKLDDVHLVNPDALIGEKQRALLRDRAVTLRGFDMQHFERDLQAATKLLNESFAKNFGFVPLSSAEIEFMAGPMKRVVRPELTVFIEIGGEPAGVGLLLPDFNLLFKQMNGELFPFGWAQFLAGAKSLQNAVGSFIATSPVHQNRGVMRVVLSELMRRLQRSGFRSLDGTWIGDVNAMSIASVKSIGMREKHRLHLYAKAI